MKGEIIKSINHYKEAIIKYRKRNDHEKTLHCLKKLHKLPIETEHLEQTKIGLTVNSLSKVVGEIGDVSKSLVTKWKIMVCKNIDREELKIKQRSDDTHKSHSNNSSNEGNPGIKSKHSNNEENQRSIKRVRTSIITNVPIKVKLDNRDLKSYTSTIEAIGAKSAVESKRLAIETHSTQKSCLSDNTLTKPQPKIIISEEKIAFEQLFNKKRQVTKIYSGSKTTVATRNFPSLYQISIEHVKKNLNTLIYTNGATFNALKPVLECATAKQLLKLEYYNPYLLENTNEMWKTLCKLQFASKTRKDMETWRDMYQRSTNEEEAKLKSIASSIRSSHDKYTTKRQIVFLNTNAPVKSRSKEITKYKYTSGNTKKSLAKFVSIADYKPKKRVYSEHNPSSQPTKAPLMKKSMSMMKGL